MWKRNKMVLVMVLVLVAFYFAVSLTVCSLGQASVIYWGLPAIYSHTPGNFISGSLSNMTARSYGAYAFTDYASSWGLNNPGYLGPGAGMGFTNLSTWGQMYPFASTYGYNPTVFNNPWMNFSPYSTYNPVYTFPNYSTFAPSYLPFNTLSPYNLGTNTAPWTIPNLLLSAPSTTTATPATTITP